MVTAATCFGYVDQPSGCNYQNYKIILLFYNYNAVKESNTQIVCQNSIFMINRHSAQHALTTAIIRHYYLKTP